MPVVPSLDPSQSVTPSQASDFQGSTTVTAGLLDQGSQQISQAGDALGQTSDAMSQIAIDAQSRITQTRVDDANNQVQAAAYALKYDPQNGYVNKTGLAAMSPDANGVMPADAAVAKLNDTAQSIRATLQPEQQRMFDMNYGEFATRFAGEALAHEGQQTRQYSLDTNNSTIKLAQDAAAQDFANADLLNAHIAAAGSAAYKNAQVQGLGGPTLDQTVKAAESDTIIAAYQAAVAKGDFTNATAIQSKYGAFLTADHAVAVDKTQAVINDQTIGAAVARSALLPTAVAATPAGQAFGANVRVESGGKQLNADGTPVTSSKGAIGVAQVTPDTGPEAAVAAGVPWDPVAFRTNAAYNRLLGQAYWAKQLAANNGDMQKADAAYNGGPGALDAAIAKAQAAGAPNTWLQYMSPETQAYVQKVAAARQSGAVSTPTKADVYAAIDTDPRIVTPGQRAVAYAAADRQFDAQQEAIKQRYTQALASAQASILQAKGDLTQVPATMLASVNPKDVPDLLSYAGKIREGGTTTNPALYQDVVTNLPKYAAMSDAQWYSTAQPNLSADDFKTLTKQRADVINDTGSNAPGSLNLSAINDVVSQRLTSMGINPSPKMAGYKLGDIAHTAGYDVDLGTRVAAIRQFINDGILDAQKQAGRKFTEGEIATFVDGQFARSVTLHNSLSFGLFSIDRGTQTYNMLTTDNREVPDDVWKKLRDDFWANGVSDPTYGQMMGAFWHYKNAQERAAGKP
ncbi:transglycosylase SLT domain-containing protein [Paraburkholderia sediminicola]|uniref:transglycosylase SLT domain-containing protein n=1 Tax=Paraburkholderia TaxID=1822464 RepID=UPI0038BA0D48